MSATLLRPLRRSSSLLSTSTTTTTTFSISSSTTKTQTTIKSPTASRSFSSSTPNSALELRRPRRPWTFDQIVVLSDGSSYKQLTTSPSGVVRCTKDVRNHPLWNPSLQRLLNVEEDEAGRLERFRRKYGSGFDSKDGVRKGADTSAEAVRALEEKEKNNTVAGGGDDNLLDLLAKGVRAPVQKKVVEPPKKVEASAKKGKKGK